MGACCSIGVTTDRSIHAGVNPTNGSSSNGNFPASLPPTRSESDILRACKLKKFTYDELRMATGNFRDDNLLGAGDFGSVFKGWVDEHSLTPKKTGTGLAVAVKRLNNHGSEGHKQWLAEINYLGQLYHPNLVTLMGYCLEDDHRLLVYEFMPQGSVGSHLFETNSSFQPLSWSIRMKAILGAAKGLAFLHISESKVIYRDFKTSDILLDSNYNAKLSDFGLARDGPTGDRTHVSTKTIGNSGYAAPEFHYTGHLSAKSDVYSFGVVLLELLTGRRAVDRTLQPKEQILVEWAKPYLSNKHKTFQILDPRLEGKYSSSQVLAATNLAAQCLSKEPKSRPKMDDVVTALEQLQGWNDTVDAAHEKRQSRLFQCWT